jgi:epoxyqueuosine reductase
MTLPERTHHIKDYALQTGFSLVGIAEAVPLHAEMATFSEWLRRGYHAGMGYMERNDDKRFDVRNILPDVRSVLVVAQNYFSPAYNADAPENDHGKLSRYAAGDDYHDVIPPKLLRIADEIRQCVPGASTKVYTDTGAILEKQWAVRAGIGWQGKHSNVISREIGSWFFLGIVLTSAEFCYDQPALQDFCGSCTACLQQCPTQAIVEPRVVDAARCISYWTIETKPDVPIPHDIAQNMDGWLFGCDTCQDVCPWNRFQTPTDETRFEPRGGESALPLESVAEMTQEEFSTRFRKSPVKRPKIAGLKRNAAALAGNTYRGNTHG